MNQFFAAGSALILALVLWGLRKKPHGIQELLLKNTLPISSRGLVENRKSFKTESKNSGIELLDQWFEPCNSQERFHLRKKLFGLITLGPEERLQAVVEASKWGDQSILPILKIGLRDADSRIVLRAAQAMEKFRGRKSLAKTQEIERPPRNVFLMR